MDEKRTLNFFTSSCSSEQHNIPICIKNIYYDVSHILYKLQHPLV